MVPSADKFMWRFLFPHVLTQMRRNIVINNLVLLYME